MTQLFANNARGTLNAPIGTTDLSLVLATGNGVSFPSPGTGDWFLATLVGYDTNSNENAWEIVKVTARTSDTLSIVRAQENTTAAAWGAGAPVELRFTAGALGNLAQTSVVNAQIAAIDTVGPALCLS